MTYRPFDLTGKVALVIGGDGGIGLGMAEALAEAGSDVIGREQHQSQPAFGERPAASVRVQPSFSTHETKRVRR